MAKPSSDTKKSIWQLGVAVTVAVTVGVFLVLVFFTVRYEPRQLRRFSPISQLQHDASPSLDQTNITSAHSFIKPKDVPVVGFVFFGRRSRVEVLRCYVERNLVDNGGWLDEVHWVNNTEQGADLDYLQQILDSSPRHKVIDVSQKKDTESAFENAWGQLDRGKLYIKMDDDVVWMADDTIPRMVTMKIAHAEYLVVSANVVNSPLMGWVHYRQGAMHPYLPNYEVVTAEATHGNDSVIEPPSSPSWRYTDHPLWEEPKDGTFDLEQDAPYDRHRWLRLVDDTDLHRTPVTGIEYDTFGSGLRSWAIAAQQHYSFLENLLDDGLHLYKGAPVWLCDYQRLSINLIAVWADDVLDHLPIVGDDEHWLTEELPQRLGKSVAVETRALGAHLSFEPQDEGIQLTDLLASGSGPIPGQEVEAEGASEGVGSRD